MKTKLLLFLFLFPLTGYSQFSIIGKVKNKISHQPVSYASVFLSNSSIGSKTDDNGKFFLQNVQPGKYEIVVSILGYDTYKESIVINSENLELPDILIVPKVLQLKGVVIKSNRQEDENRADYLAWFKDEFLGRSPLSADCKILNPEILDFDYDEPTKTLNVTAPDFLEIDNFALGYHLKYLLHDFQLAHKGDTNEYVHFEGSVLFEKMKGSVSKEKAWQKERLEAYEGSPMHFLRDIITPQGNSDFPKFFADGFWVLRLLTYTTPQRPSDSLIHTKIDYFKSLESPSHRDSLNKWKKISALPKSLKKLYPDTLGTKDFLKRTNQKDIYALGLSRRSYSLFINYEKGRLKQMRNGMIKFNAQPIDDLASPTNTENTLVRFNEASALFDKNGQIFDANSMTFSGVWARSRVANLLPIDYVPIKPKKHKNH